MHATDRVEIGFYPPRQRDLGAAMQHQLQATGFLPQFAVQKVLARATDEMRDKAVLRIVVDFKERAVLHEFALIDDGNLVG